MRSIGLVMSMLLCLSAVATWSVGLRQAPGERMLEKLLVEMRGYECDALPAALSPVADRKYRAWLNCMTDEYRPPASAELRGHVGGGRSMDVLATAYTVESHHVRLVQSRWIVMLCVDVGSEKLGTEDATRQFVSGIAMAAFTEGGRADLVAFDSGDGRLRGRQAPRPPDMQSKPWNWFDTMTWYVRDREVWLAFLKTHPDPPSAPRVDAKGNYDWLE